MDLAYVIHQYAYGDTSAIVKLWSKELGYVTAMAKGVKTRRQQKNMLQPFLFLEVDLVGKGNIFNLKSIQIMGDLTALQGKSLYAGLYLNELLMRLLPEKEPLPSLFNEYQHTLGVLSTGILEPALRTFEWNLLTTLGYMPTLSINTNLDPINPSAYYELLPGTLPIQVSSPTARNYLGAHLLAIEQQEWHDPEVLKTAKYLMRSWIDHYTGHKPLKSRSLFQ